MIKIKFLAITFLSVAAINLHAETVFQQMGRAQDTMAQVSVLAEQRAQRAEAQANADREAQARAAYAAEQQRLAQQRAMEEKQAQEQFEINCLLMSARVRREYSNPLVMALPTSDSDQTIRAFLATRGYKNLSQADIDALRALLVRHGLHHINEIDN